MTQKFSTQSFSFGHDRTRVTIQKKIPVATDYGLRPRKKIRPEFSTEATEKYFFFETNVLKKIDKLEDSRFSLREISPNYARGKKYGF